MEQSVTAFNELIASTPPELSDEWLLFHLQQRRDLLLRHLAATLEAEHSRKAALMALDEEYKLLSSAFPAASLPYIRRHHIADALERPAEAVALLEQAAEFVDADPYLILNSSSQFHWLQSFVRRRLMAKTISAAAAERFRHNSLENLPMRSASGSSSPLNCSWKWSDGTFLLVRTRLTLPRRSDGPTTKSSFTRAG